jgi:hypothetical protein
MFGSKKKPSNQMSVKMFSKNKNFEFSKKHFEPISRVILFSPRAIGFEFFSKTPKSRLSSYTTKFWLIGQNVLQKKLQIICTSGLKLIVLSDII